MKRQILFVDDEPNVLQALRRILSPLRKQWEMRFVSSPFEVMELLINESFDVVVSDVIMPGKSGLELLAEIKSDARTRDIEVIILTGSEDKLLKRQALDSGATDLLNKPICREDLIARLKNSMRMKLYRDDIQIQNRKLEQQLIQSQRMEVVGMLAAGAIHDLNNILGMMSLNIDLIKLRYANDMKMQASLCSTENAGQRAKNIVNQILEFSREKEPKFEPCEIGQIVDECLELLRNSILKQIKVEWRNPGISSVTMADSTQIFQLLMNLFINAIQAMEQGGTLKITLSESHVDQDPVLIDDELKSEDYLKIEVSDSGYGMDAETKEHVFNPLYSKKRSQGGSGLGLSVVERIVKINGGKITVDSALGQGTTFCVYLPACLVREEDIINPAELEVNNG